MTVPHHRMPVDMFTAIARSRAGVSAVETLARAQESKVKLLLREVVDRVTGPRAVLVAAAYDQLASVGRDDPAVLREVLRHPVVGAWAVEAANTARLDGSPGPERMAYVAAAAAIRSGGRYELSLPAPRTPEPIVPLPTLGHVVLPARAAGPVVLRTGSGGARLCQGTVSVTVGAGDPRFIPVPWIRAEADGLRIGLQLDRASWLLAPGLTGRGQHPIERWGQDTEAWAGHLTAAWQVLVARHRPVAEEAAATYTLLTPLASPSRGQNSGTYEDAFGCLAMSPPIHAVFGAATVAHELRHAELAVLMDLFTLVEPDDDGLYYAPWRPDPRPARGLLHGVYAHLGLSAFWAAEASAAGPGSEAEIQLARWRQAAASGAQTLLDEARLTELGRLFVTAVRDELRRWGQVPISAAAAESARRQAETHRREWLRRNCVDR
ncbi:HEXXH motif-containing putative peptide modification protein [Actinoplanes sp. NPDC049802]|uniref:aKG-HExxH-type peptide beta-hydroxylase n=1 Tax=Actinoplanes sp. NPDC049802 TaxID=3154742 RepID=UPI0033DC2D6C